MLRAIVLAFVLLASAAAWAHEPSRSVLTLGATSTGIEGRLDVSLRDLEDAIGLDADGDAAITWGEVAARQRDIAAYALRRLAVSSGGIDCELAAEPGGIDTHGGASFAVLALAGRCDARPADLRVDYSLLFEIDRAHRAIVTIGSAGSINSAVLSFDERAFTAALSSAGGWASLRRFIAEGARHIWHGYDHLAFVILLVLPILLGNGRRAASTFSPGAAAGEIVRVVTAFTVAHSLTLALAAAGWVPIPTRIVEVVIAASVLLAAIANVVPRVGRLGPKLAFAFGLVHGFGFAGALGELAADTAALLPTLAGFNLGVELGQLAVVVAVFPLLVALRRSRVLCTSVTFTGSALCAAFALAWLAERVVG